MDPHQIAYFTSGISDVHGHQMVRLANHLPWHAASFFIKHMGLPSYHRVLGGALLLGDQGL